MYNMNVDEKGKRSLPAFICIGAQRTGTTWLYQCLKEHPEVYMPEKKELHFFNYNYSDGLESYCEHFRGAAAGKVIGEVTPGYYRDEEALVRIKEHIPDVKLIFIVRNPIERAYSQYELYYGTEKKMSFSDAYRDDPNLVDWGKYGKFLEDIYSKFDRDKVIVLDYRVLKDDPREFLQQVFSFIGVSPGFMPANLTKRYNKVIYPRAQKLLNNLGLQFLIELVKKTWVGDLIRNRQKDNKLKMANRDFDYLAESFAGDVRKLGELLDSDYSYWLKR
jgi:hypothetical protein